MKSEQLLQMQIRITIHTTPDFGSGVTLSQDIAVRAHGFIELCRILGQFQELADKLAEQAK